MPLASSSLLFLPLSFFFSYYSLSCYFYVVTRQRWIEIKLKLNLTQNFCNLCTVRYGNQYIWAIPLCQGITFWSFCSCPSPNCTPSCGHSKKSPPPQQTLIIMIIIIIIINCKILRINVWQCSANLKSVQANGNTLEFLWKISTIRLTKSHHTLL